MYGRVVVWTSLIATVLPGCFVAAQAGYAVAVVTRMKSDGSQSVEELAGGAIDLGPATDQVYPSLFGIAIRGRSALPAVTACWKARTLRRGCGDLRRSAKPI